MKDRLKCKVVYLGKYKIDDNSSPWWRSDFSSSELLPPPERPGGMVEVDEDDLQNWNHGIVEDDVIKQRGFEKITERAEDRRRRGPKAAFVRETARVRTGGLTEQQQFIIHLPDELSSGLVPALLWAWSGSRARHLARVLFPVAPLII